MSFFVSVKGKKDVGKRIYDQLLSGRINLSHYNDVFLDYGNHILFVKRYLEMVFFKMKISPDFFLENLPLFVGLDLDENFFLTTGEYTFLLATQHIFSFLRGAYSSVRMARTFGVRSIHGFNYVKKVNDEYVLFNDNEDSSNFHFSSLFNSPPIFYENKNGMFNGLFSYDVPEGKIESQRDIWMRSLKMIFVSSVNCDHLVDDGKERSVNQVDVNECDEIDNDGQGHVSVEKEMILDDILYDDLPSFSPCPVKEYFEKSSEKKHVDIRNGKKNALSVLYFLGRIKDMDFINEFDNICVVGAANNNHLVALGDWFYDKHVHIYDLEPKKIYNYDRENITYHEGEVTVDTIFPRSSILISDIRRDAPEDEFEKNVHMDNLLQIELLKKEEFVCGTIKFRFPFLEEDYSYDCPYTEIFLQAYKGPYSAETRLVWFKGYENHNLSNIEKEIYLGKMLGHNAVRFDKKRMSKICYDCFLSNSVLDQFPILPHAWAVKFGRRNTVVDLILESTGGTCDCKRFGSLYWSNCKLCAILEIRCDCRFSYYRSFVD